MTERFNQCIISLAFKYADNQCPNYLNEVFQTAPENNIQTRGSFLKLKCPFRKTNAGQMALSYIDLHYLTLVQPYEAKTLTHLREQKISTRLNII